VEIERRSFFVGVSGRLLLDLLAEANKTLPRGVRHLRYDDLWITNAILGKPKVDLSKFLTRMHTENRARGREYRDALRRIGAGARSIVPRPDIMLDPLMACRPRLMRELVGRRVVVPMGSYALAAIDPKKKGILKWFGGPFEVDFNMEAT
jgi:uracil-DNA glycosylase